MARPIIWTIDDDPEVLRAVERDLREHYGSHYRILRAEGGAQALDSLHKLALRDETVALFLVDQRMPQMSGVEFLLQAKEQFPDAKRVLLTAYSDTDAAIRAINDVRIDRYLTKPWAPPQEKLFPVLDTLLQEWNEAYNPESERIRVIGHRWCPETHVVKDFLSRNLVKFQWIDLEAPPTDSQTTRLLKAIGPDPHPLPIVLFPDGSCLAEPNPAQLAEKIPGLNTRASNPFYDLVIVGGGPAGLAAAVYGASEGLCTLMIEKEAPGGQAGTSSRIENYLGFPEGVRGDDLAGWAVEQARKFDVEIVSPQEVTGLRVEDSYRILTLGDGSEVSCHAVVLAMGVAWRRLDVPGMDRLNGAGVYYGAAMTEAAACKDEEVYVVGGANSAGQAAMHFSKFAKRVTMLVRGDGLSATMSQYLINQIEETPNITVCTHCEVAEALGESRLEHLVLHHKDTGEKETVSANSLFIFIGAEPQTDWLNGIVERDAKGFVKTGLSLLREGKRKHTFWKLERDPFLLETSVPGIFAAGDVVCGSVKRVASGVGAGSISISFVHEYLSTLR